MSTKPPLNVIGLMSGTSTDGIDGACVRIQMSENPLRLLQCELLEGASAEYPPTLRELLLSMVTQPTVSLAALTRCQVEIGECFAQVSQTLIDQLARQDIAVDLIASHGQTLYHIPPEPGQQGATLQIGQPAIIAERTGIPVVADFRPRDMAVGGHGAPLVPFADRLLFHSDEEDRIALNLGGIANLTVLPRQDNQPSIAFDTGPSNMMIDALMEALYQRPYDADGQIGASGKVIEPILAQWLDDPYFQQAPPKSTGRERFGKPFALKALEANADAYAPQDWIATATAFTVRTIVLAIEQFVLPKTAVKTVIASGGGIYNRTLMAQLSAALNPFGLSLKTTDDFGVSSRYKEAIAFALLGYAHHVGITNNVPSCTGASKPVVMGATWPGASGSA